MECYNFHMFSRTAKPNRLSGSSEPKSGSNARHVVLLIVAIVLICDTALGCPTCKDSLVNSDPDSANLVRGYFWSILFMMSMPFLILGSLASYFYYEICKARRLLAVDKPTTPELVTPN
jgi:hypothetical protein